MISEAIDMLPPTKVIAYKTGAMNEVHKAHLISELAMGRISILEGYSRLKAPALNPTASHQSSIAYSSGHCTKDLGGAYQEG